MIGKLKDNSILLPNGIKFLIRESETRAEFIDRVKATVEDDYCEELEIKEVSCPAVPPEEAQEIYEETKHMVETSNPQGYYNENLHKFCTFTKRNSKKTVEGMIIWVYLDKRKDLLYYRVRDGLGTIHIVRVNNPTLSIRS